MKKQLSFRHRLVCALPLVLTLWLIQEGCYKRFLENACYEKDIRFLESLERGISVHYVMRIAFMWDNSNEGYNYWYRKCYHFEKQLLNL